MEHVIDIKKEEYCFEKLAFGTHFQKWAFSGPKTDVVV